jgi:hypothetical protein
MPFSAWLAPPLDLPRLFLTDGLLGLVIAGAAGALLESVRNADPLAWRPNRRVLLVVRTHSHLRRAHAIVAQLGGRDLASPSVPR